MPRHNLGPESSQWAGEVELALRTAEGLVPGAGGRIRELNGQVRRQMNAVGPLTRRVSEMAPADFVWNVQGSIPSGGGFVGSSPSFSAPGWSSSAILLYATVTSTSATSQGIGHTVVSNESIEDFNFSQVFAAWEVSNGVRYPTNPVLGGFSGMTVGDLTRLHFRFHVSGPLLGGNPSGSVNATFRIGVLWLP